jgi:hypothetical protein
MSHVALHQAASELCLVQIPCIHLQYAIFLKENGLWVHSNHSLESLHGYEVLHSQLSSTCVCWSASPLILCTNLIVKTPN